jgi:hypothetical protein
MFVLSWERQRRDPVSITGPTSVGSVEGSRVALGNGRNRAEPPSRIHAPTEQNPFPKEVKTMDTVQHNNNVKC